MWESKVAKIKSDEYIVLRVKKEEGEVREMEYLTSGSTRSRWRIDAKVFFTENDATSALVIKRMRGDKLLKVKELEKPSQKEQTSRSQVK